MFNVNDQYMNINESMIGVTYPKEGSSVLEFIQRFVFHINPEVGSRSFKNTKTGKIWKLIDLISKKSTTLIKKGLTFLFYLILRFFKSVFMSLL